jgi:hypothetical protein
MELRLSAVGDTLRDRPFVAFVALSRVLTRAAGPPALLRAVPPFAAMALFAAIIFGGNGMRTRDLCAVLASSLPARAAFWAAWLLIAAPAARALLETSETFALRALPVPPWQFWLIHGAHLTALQAPWLVLFSLGAGPAAGVAQALAAAAACALGVARPRAPADVAAALTLALTLAVGAPAWALLGVALATGAVGVAAAWTRAPERGARAGASIVAGAAPTALALAHVAVLIRRDGVALLRGAAAALVGAAVVALAVRNNAVADAATRETIALAAGAIPLALATGGVGVRIVETERRLGWLLLTTAATARLRALAAVAVTTAWGAAMGAVYGATAALGAASGAAQGLSIALLGVGLGASLGAASACFARRAEQPSGVDGTEAAIGMAVSAIAVTVLSGSLGAAALAPLAAAAIALAAWTPGLLARRERRTELVVHLPWSEP